MQIVVLRLGHRPERDKRITTHVGLVARAFGADEMLLAGQDEKVVQSLRDVVDRWGGDFQIKSEVIWKKEVRRWKESKGTVVHLTMYGSSLSDVIEDIRQDENIMVVVGAEKVPAEMYQLADWNVGIGDQPHSEVAALAIFLDRLQEGQELDKKFEGKIQISPSERSKNVNYPVSKEGWST
ncbi:MAG: tRNA (cytidine(56)-2'-O)-methyltransferase [Methanotrichaceae archaeon]